MLDFWVQFNSKHAVFFPNSQVTATVYLETDKILKARKIDIRVIGVAKTLWHEYYLYGTDTYGHNRSENIPYGAEIYYINAYALLWRSRDGTNRLQPGKYQFPFEFFIPANAPPCMGGQYGSILSYITNIDIPWAPDEERFCGFSVCQYVDLNLDRRLTQAVYTVGTETQSKCCSCSELPLNVKFSIPKTGYTPGEIIQLKIKVTNKTTWTITKFEIGIVQNLIYTGYRQSVWGYGDWYGPHSMSRFTSNVVTTKKIIVNSSINESTAFTIKVPPLVSSYHACPIISNNYTVFVKTFTDAVFSSGLEVLFPITIGSVPIRDSSAPTPSQPPVAPKAASPSTTTPTENEKSFKKMKNIGSNKSSTPEKDNTEVAVSP